MIVEKHYFRTPLVALLSAFFFSACTDYAEQYEGDYKAEYGDAEAFERNLNDVSKWGVDVDCQSDDYVWEWCFESDGKYALATFAGSAWESFVDGDARLVFSGTDNAGHSYTTNLLTEDNVLHMLRHSGGLRVEVSMASGDFSTGVQVKLQNDELDKPIYPAMLLRYTNECGDAFAGLKYVDGDGKVVSEYRWDKLAVGEQLSSTLKFDDLHYVSGQKDSEFLKKANTFEVGLSGCSDTHKGVMVYAVGIVYDSKNEGKSSSSEGGSNGGTTNSNGGSNDKSSSSVSSNGSTASSSSAGTSNGSTATSSSVGTSNGNTASSSSVDNHDYGFLWRGVDKNNYVETDFGSDPWTDYTDSRDQTKILRPQNSYDICFGQCGLVSFGTGYVDGNNTTAPYASISFVISNGREEDVLDKWGGVCVTYASNDTATLYLSIGAEDSVYGYGMPMAKLLSTPDKDTAFATVQLKWDEFHQPDWAKKVISGPDVAKILRKIQINFDGKYGGYGETQYFNIYEIGSYGKCGPAIGKDIPTWNRSRFNAAIDSSKLNREPYAPLIETKDLLWYGGNKIKGGASYRVQAAFDYDYPIYEFDTYIQRGEGSDSDQRITNCGGAVCGTIKHTIVEGGGQFRTAAISFDFASSTNLKEWGGLCVTYSSDKKMWLQLGRSSTTNIIDTVTLVPTDNALVDTCFSWLDFGAYTYGATLKDGRYLDKVNSVKFRFLPESYDANFKIVAIGKCTECKSELAWDFLNPDITYDTIIDSRDKQPYKYVRIGNYEWMAENLNYDGSEGVCSGNAPKNCAKFGRLYSPRSDLCPAGWRLPRKEDFEDLIASAGGAKTDDSDDSSASNLKSLYGWNSAGTYVRKTTDKFGFSAVPAGYADEDGTSRDFPGKAAYFWGQQGDRDTDHYYMKIHYTNNGAELGQNFIDYGTKYSIRCVRGSVYDEKNGTLKDLRDGRVYKTTVIGDQTWMAEDLGIRTSVQSTATSVCNESGVSMPGTLCAYNAYTWGAAMGFSDKLETANSTYMFKSYNLIDKSGVGYNPPSPYQGICPDGWHIPTYTEFNTLLTYATLFADNHSLDLEKVLKSKSWDSGTDNLGFGASIGNVSQFTLWGVTEWKTDYLSEGDHPKGVTAFIIRKSSATGDKVQLSYGVTKTYDVAVRCLKDN